LRLLLDAGRIEPGVVANIRSWRHSGFSVDRSVRLPAGDRDGLERLGQYMARSPFSLARLIRITRTGQVVYHAEKHRPHRFPDPAGDDLFGGIARNFQLFEPLDVLAELTQHIPDQGEHLVRYYGYYSSKSRGLRARQTGQSDQGQGDPPTARTGAGRPAHPDARARSRFRGWAMLIQRIYQVDPLLCPKCGGAMKIIAFIEARQGDVIRRILEHCSLWKDLPRRPPPRGPPQPSGRSGGRCPVPEADASVTYEADPEYLEHARRDAIGEDHQPQLSWEP
jgi:hypothetical protein